MNPSIVLSFVAAVAVTACAASFDPGSRVTSLRVLAVHADQPFAHPGEEVHLDTLSFDPAGRAITWGWATCVNPEEATVAGCFAKSGGLAIGSASTFSLTVPVDALDALPAEARDHALVGVVAVACPATLSPGAVTFGADTYPFRCVDANGRELGLDEMEVGLRRITVRATDRNANPGIASVTWDGADWAEGDVKDVGACDTTGNSFDSCDAALAHAIDVTLTAGSIESGTDESGVPFTEQVVVQYFATEGIFEHDVRTAAMPDTRWVARSSASGETLTMWILARDDRGGVTWATRQVKVR